MVIELITFRLRAGAEEAAFLAADERAQQDVAYHQRGLVRRTTARGDDGGWLVEVLWQSAADADAAAGAWGSHPAAGALAALVDPATVSRRRYETLD